MAADFKAIGQYDTVLATIASATVIEPGDLVALTSGVVTKANASSAEIAFAPAGSAEGETQIEVTVGRVQLEGTGDAAFAVTQKGTEVDIVGTTTLLIDVGASATDVLRISAKEDAGTVGSTDGIKVEINKPINF
jgi:hypothetical protein